MISETVLSLGDHTLRPVMDVKKEESGMDVKTEAPGLDKDALLEGLNEAQLKGQ